MEEAAASFNKQVTKLGRDVKAWPVWSWLKDTVDAFKKTMPLITDLRNPAMRPRHWQQLMDHINTRSAGQHSLVTINTMLGTLLAVPALPDLHAHHQHGCGWHTPPPPPPPLTDVIVATACMCAYRFDPGSTRFTLESVVSLRLDQHCDFIAELSVTASKEQAIESSLANIASTWAELWLDMAEYKGTFKLRSTEDIFVALEDNGVTLSTMKASKYYLVFEEQVAHWERTLALASETVEMILQVRKTADLNVAGLPELFVCLLAASITRPAGPAAAGCFWIRLQLHAFP